MRTREITILQNDAAGPGVWPESLSIVRSGGGGVLGRAKNLIVLSSLSRVSDVAESVKDANKTHRLRGLLVRSDVDPHWSAVLLDRANIRALRNLVVHRGREIPRRVVEAWAAGAQQKLIADATIIGDRLLVVGCDFERIEVTLAEIPALRNARALVRRRFEIDEDGSFLYWPDLDVHLDRRAIEAFSDPEERRRQEIEKMAHGRRFGQAMRRLRKQAGVMQRAMPGVSERHVRRIEEGHWPKVDTLEKLAAGCGMSLDDYLDRLASAMENR